MKQIRENHNLHTSIKLGSKRQEKIFGKAMGNIGKIEKHRIGVI